ncbi:4719_t:CDS:2, partial [Ambispora leptoticha]
AITAPSTKYQHAATQNQQDNMTRNYTYPPATTTTITPSNTPRRHRRDTSFMEQLLSDPILQTLADIGKQEGSFIAPLPITHNIHYDHRRMFTATPRRMESA